MEKKYFWLRLKKDFFKRHDIRIIEAGQNGAEKLLIYLKLLAESIDHAGCLRYSEDVPYDAGMLSAITNSNIDLMEKTIKELLAFGLMEQKEDGTFYMTKIDSMLGSCASDEQAKEKHRERQRRYRERKKIECDANVTHSDACVTDSDASCDVTVTENVTESIEYRDKINRNIINNISCENVTHDKSCEERQKIIDSYNSICKSFPKVTKISEARKRAVNARLKKFSIEEFEKVFKLAEASDFLKGKNSHAWKANFDWLINETNMTKVLDGNYENRKPTSNNKFNEMIHTEYDMEELERRLLS